MDTWLGPVFTDLMENKKFSDCRIVVGPETFDCHKLILSSASEFFERMFLGDFKESTTGQFVVNDVKPETFRHFLEYVYTYKIENLEKHSSTILMDLLGVGVKWLVESIQSGCVELLTKRAEEMIVGDLVALLQFAHNINNEDLINVVKMNLKQRFGQFMNCFDALMLTSDVFEQYLIFSDSCLPEVERFKMIEAYVTVNGLHDPDSGYAEANKVEDSDVGEIKDVITSLSTFVGASIPAEGEKLVNSKELCDVKNVDDTVTKMSQLRVGAQKENKLKSIHAKYVRLLLGYIKYERMTKNQFYDVVGKSNLLNFKEKFEKLYITKQK